MGDDASMQFVDIVFRSTVSSSMAKIAGFDLGGGKAGR